MCSEEISFCYDDGRAFVKPYLEVSWDLFKIKTLKLIIPSKGSRFRVRDKVLLIVFQKDGQQVLEGPYLIESVPRLREYTLCTEEGARVQNGMVVKQEQLKEAD